ncbi:roadblock/LC7 domain-containing protein [bacterium]|nr:roadblock/LC7 domain-containing protein [bacterium]
MIPVNRLTALVIITFLGLVAIPMAFASTPVLFESAAVMVPVVLVAELLIYFILTLVTNPRMTIPTVAVLAVTMALARAVASVIGAGIASWILGTQGTGAGAEVSYLVAWAGNPMSVISQALLLVLVTPHILESAIPELVGPELREKLGSTTPIERPTQKGGGTAHVDTMPSGGFIQSFSYDELAGVIKKSHGLEGFLIYNSEGLIVWRDFPLRMDLDRLVAKITSLQRQMGAVVEDAGLTRMRKVMVESKEHLIFITDLNQNFGLVMVYNSQVSPEDCYTRLAVISKSAREFLQWKYPSLPVTASLFQSAESAVKITPGA